MRTHRCDRRASAHLNRSIATGKATFFLVVLAVAVLYAAPVDSQEQFDLTLVPQEAGKCKLLTESDWGSEGKPVPLNLRKYQPPPGEDGGCIRGRRFSLHYAFEESRVPTDPFQSLLLNVAFAEAPSCEANAQLASYIGNIKINPELWESVGVCRGTATIQSPDAMASEQFVLPIRAFEREQLVLRVPAVATARWFGTTQIPVSVENGTPWKDVTVHVGVVGYDEDLWRQRPELKVRSGSVASSDSATNGDRPAEKGEGGVDLAPPPRAGSALAPTSSAVVVLKPGFRALWRSFGVEENGPDEAIPLDEINRLMGEPGSSLLGRLDEEIVLRAEWSVPPHHWISDSVIHVNLIGGDVRQLGFALLGGLLAGLFGMKAPNGGRDTVGALREGVWSVCIGGLAGLLIYSFVDLLLFSTSSLLENAVAALGIGFVGASQARDEAVRRLMRSVSGGIVSVIEWLGRGSNVFVLVFVLGGLGMLVASSAEPAETPVQVAVDNEGRQTLILTRQQHLYALDWVGGGYRRVEVAGSWRRGVSSRADESFFVSTGGVLRPVIVRSPDLAVVDWRGQRWAALLGSVARSSLPNVRAGAWEVRLEFVPLTGGAGGSGVPESVHFVRLGFLSAMCFDPSNARLVFSDFARGQVVSVELGSLSGGEVVPEYVGGGMDGPTAIGVVGNEVFAGGEGFAHLWKLSAGSELAERLTVGRMDVASVGGDLGRGAVYAADLALGRIVKLDLGGKVVVEKFGDGEFKRAVDVAVDFQGHVWIADDWSREVVELDGTGRAVNRFAIGEWK